MLQQVDSFNSQSLKQQQPRIVQIYIRIVTTKSIKIRLPSQVQVSTLKQIIKQKFKIGMEDQILFLKGVKLNFEGLVLLQNKWIIHVIDRQLVYSQFIQFHLKTQSITEMRKQVPAYYTVKSDQNVSQFIQQNVTYQYSVKLSDVLIVESGRFLKMNQTFSQQFVQSGTQINVLHVQRDRNPSSASAKSHKNLYQFSQNKQNSQVSELKFNKKQESPLKVQTKQKVPRIMTARSNFYKQDSSFKFNKSSGSAFYLNSPRVNTKNRSIPVGQKQCNCNTKKKPRQVQMVSVQDRKKRQKQIRQMNLQKLIMKKQKQGQQLNQNQNSCASKKSQSSENRLKSSYSSSGSSSKLKKMKSLDMLPSHKKKKNKYQKCQIHNHKVCQNQEQLEKDTKNETNKSFQQKQEYNLLAQF